MPTQPQSLEQTDLVLTTRFVGRGRELEEILALLQDESCRLLTLIGVGGIGKTRLALRVLQEALPHFDDGVCVVSLQSVQTQDGLISAIADELGLALSGQTHPADQLLHYLQPRHLLLLLDNFEQLRPAAGFLSQITRRTESVKLLVTSREALNIQDEWRYWLEGLPVPRSQETESLEEYDAVRLFVDRAQHMQPGFRLAGERAGVVRICQLVEGMPLALEMAASWTKTMRCAEIAAEIQRNLTFLQSNLDDVIARHGSMQAVFAQTWARMEPDAQQIFTRLSVFRGGFDRAAAAAVAGATLLWLSNLLDRCLIRRDTTGRYQIHELLRQFAEEKLSPSEMRAVADAHMDYYVTFTAERRIGTVEHTQVETSREIESELGNIRAAWQHAVAKANAEALAKAAPTYFYACQIQSRFLESAQASEQAVNVMERLGHTSSIAQISVYWGWMLIRIGRFDEADTVLVRAKALFEQLDLNPVYGMGSHPVAPLVILRNIQGNYEQAVELGEALKQRSIAKQDLHNLSFACYGLTGAYVSLGQHELAQQNARQATRVAEKVGNRWFQAYCLIEWGKSAVALQQYTEAKAHFQTALTIREEFSDPEGMAVTLVHLADIACAQEDYATARRFCERSLSIYRDLNDEGGLASAYRGLGQIATHLGEPAQAAAHYRQALATAASIHFLPLVLSILIDIADLFMTHRLSERARTILVLILHHPAATAQQRQAAGAKLGDVDLSGIRTLDLDTLILMLRSELTNFAPIEPKRQHQLVEPLTDRELDVLRLIARGLSNGEIAEALIIATGTVKAHTNRIYSKLQVANRVAAVEQARLYNLLEK